MTWSLCLNSFRLLREISFLPLALSHSPILRLLQNAGWWLMCSMCSPFISLSLTFSLLLSSFILLWLSRQICHRDTAPQDMASHTVTAPSQHTLSSDGRLKRGHTMPPQTHSHFDVIPRLMNGWNVASHLHGCSSQRSHGECLSMFEGAVSTDADR